MRAAVGNAQFEKPVLRAAGKDADGARTLLRFKETVHERVFHQRLQRELGEEHIQRFIRHIDLQFIPGFIAHAGDREIIAHDFQLFFDAQDVLAAGQAQPVERGQAVDGAVDLVRHMQPGHPPDGFEGIVEKVRLDLRLQGKDLQTPHFLFLLAFFLHQLLDMIQQGIVRLNEGADFVMREGLEAGRNGFHGVRTVALHMGMKAADALDGVPENGQGDEDAGEDQGDAEEHHAGLFRPDLPEQEVSVEDHDHHPAGDREPLIEERFIFPGCLVQKARLEAAPLGFGKAGEILRGCERVAALRHNVPAGRFQIQRDAAARAHRGHHVAERIRGDVNAQKPDQVLHMLRIAHRGEEGRGTGAQLTRGIETAPAPALHGALHPAFL